MWCWRRMEKMSWTNHVRYEGVLQRVKEERNIPQTIKRKANRICHILHRNCPLKKHSGEKYRGKKGSDRKKRNKT
jgi:hypothetical protein